MRSRVVAVVVVILTLVPSVARANEFRACWVTAVWNPTSLQENQVTRCRISGGNTVDYASDSAVPAVLSPNLGTDANGLCWYLTSATTQYIVITQWADGSADIAYVVDPSTPDDIIVVGPNLPRCTSEPNPLPDPESEAWDYTMTYVHDPPTPDLNPEPGQGVTGLATYIGVDVPDDHQATLTSPFSTIEVEIAVTTVIVRWGDGEVSTYPADPDILAGYPDGTATHSYEVKDPDGRTITVEYDWHARWRTTGGSWTTLPVPNTTTSTNYPVAEVVSRLSD